jgi:hypothetical protein
LPLVDGPLIYDVAVSVRLKYIKERDMMGCGCSRAIS